MFEEIGREFARLLALPTPDGAIDPTAFASFRESLRPGDPPDGQGWLRQAFTAYAAALHEGDRKARAELMLLANLAIGFHEQTRLQPQIAEALDAPFEEPVKLRRDLLARLLNLHAGLAFRMVLELVPGRATSLTEVLDDLDRLVKQIAHEAITELLMTLTLPGEVLRLGRDVPGAFPAGLEAIDNPDLSALLGRIDPTRDSTRGSGADDWSMLAERIHFIADFFRVYQERPNPAERPVHRRAGGRDQVRRPAGRPTVKWIRRRSWRPCSALVERGVHPLEQPFEFVDGRCERRREPDRPRLRLLGQDLRRPVAARRRLARLARRRRRSTPIQSPAGGSR